MKITIIKVHPFHLLAKDTIIQILLVLNQTFSKFIVILLEKYVN